MGAPIVTLLDCTTNPEQKIATYAAKCYNSKTDDMSNEKRMQGILKNGHLATLRFASATFEVSNITRICSHQFVRSKHLDFLQQSQRYVNQLNTNFTTPQDVLKNQQLLSDYAATAASCYILYDKMIKQGIKKEDARFILPEATNTSLIVTGNFQAWKDFIRLRKDKAAQWEIRDVAIKIERELNKVAPNVFNLEI